MKHTETQTKEVIVETGTTCDRCGQDARQVPDYNEENYFTSQFAVNRGLAFPEGGTIYQTTMDLCPKCTEDALKALIAIGCTPILTEID